MNNNEITENYFKNIFLNWLKIFKFNFFISIKEKFYYDKPGFFSAYYY